MLVHDGNARLRQESDGQFARRICRQQTGDGIRSRREHLGGMARRRRQSQGYLRGQTAGRLECLPNTDSAHLRYPRPVQSGPRGQCRRRGGRGLAGQSQWKLGYLCLGLLGWKKLLQRGESHEIQSQRDQSRRRIRSSNAGRHLRGLAGRSQRQPGHLPGLLDEWLRHLHMESRVTSNPADQTEPKLAIDAGNIVYVFWTDRRNGQADIYAAASNAGPWTNMPIVTGAGDQTQPAVAAGSGDALHLLWVDNASGNSDIFYASLNGLPGSPVAGIGIIDDTSGADQTAPAIVCGADQKVFASWQDWRQAGSTGTDTDLYVAELRSAAPRANVFVGDDGTNASQSDPAIGVDRYGQPYVVWTDSRQATAEIYCATTTLVDPTPLDSKTVVAFDRGLASGPIRRPSGGFRTSRSWCRRELVRRISA